MSNKSSTVKQIKYDGTLTISTGRSRKETEWKNRQIDWSQLVKKLSTTTRTNETFEEFSNMPKKQRDNIKDVGGFVGGTLKGNRRKADNVTWRHLITLDADYVKGDLWAAVEMFFDFACLMYSTHSHSPNKPKLRLVVPLSRPVTPDEYQAVARRLAGDLGIDMFDDTTYEPHRLMYWPSTSKDGEYIFRYQDAPWLDPDEVLERYIDWRDPSRWPESSRAKASRQRMADKQGDPYEKTGIVGAFCRTYSISEAIEYFLSDIYEPAGEGRYSYTPGSTTGGLVVYDQDKFAYSHHGTDPISGRLVNSFDLVRLHKFGARDDDADPGTPTVKLPSYTAMVELATQDEKVRQTLGEEKLAEASEEFGGGAPIDTSWLRELEVDKKSNIKSTFQNLLLILQNDPYLAGKMAWNDFARRPVVRGDLPWRKLADGEYWQDRDDSELRGYIETWYGVYSPSKLNDAFAAVLGRNKYHPVRDYLSRLEWDGIPRLDTLLIDYLGAEDNEYVRAVTRKMFTAAVARVLAPGIKFDFVLVLVGAQGIGKSYLIKKLGGKWHSDSVNTVQGKEAYEQLQGAWLIELAELSATRKAEAEAVKHFISKQEDSYRVAYGKQVSVFPRQCVFFGTTNDITFLRDKTGNRRYWPVMVGENKRKKSLWEDITEHEINQIWAEAAAMWQEGEKLYLSGKLEEKAMEIQERHTEESEKFGLIQEYLETPLPENWDEYDIGARRSYLQGTDFGQPQEGTQRREKVCALEIWVELFNGDAKQFKTSEAREINDILRRMPGWKPYKNKNGKLRFGKLYGLQRAFVRNDYGIARNI